MKYLIGLLLAFNLISCSDSAKTEDVVEVNSFVEDTVEDSVVLEISNYSLKAFPSVWWMVTIEGEEMSIINHWDAQEMKFVIEAESDSTGFIELTYAQDSDSGPLFDFKAELSEKSDYLWVIDGSFSFVGTLEEDTTNVTFQYNRLSQCAEFKGLYYSSETFVEDSLKGVFPYVETVREED
jgi:hypothetical protein